MENEKLIRKAQSVAIKNRVTEDTIVGEVGSALITNKGNIYVGVSIDSPCGLGFCGEVSAIASMVTNGESIIKTIVAVDGEGKVHAPCGRCRETIRTINKVNEEAEIILPNKVLKLRDLLPETY